MDIVPTHSNTLKLITSQVINQTNNVRNTSLWRWPLTQRPRNLNRVSTILTKGIDAMKMYVSQVIDSIKI
jgi:hypothetical protein